MNLFDKMIRSDSGPKKDLEPTFAFLNRSGRPRDQTIRSRLESWFARYDTGKQKPLLRRFRSDDDRDHHAAFFELLLHELLLCLGCRVKVEAPISGETTTPDFLVKDPSGFWWYLEAVTVSATFRATAKAQQVMESLANWLDENLPHRDFLLLVFYTGTPSGSLPRKALLEFLRDKLRAVDYLTVLGATRSQGLSAAPHWVYQWGACRIEFQLIPRAERAREDSSVQVLHHPNSLQIIRMDQMVNRMRDALRKKARKYGRMVKPFVVALSVPDWDVDSVQFMQALFGWDDLAHGFSVGPELMKLGMPRPSGVWLEGSSHKDVRYTRLSAVACCSYLTPLNLGGREFCLYNNPWAAHPYESVLNCLPRCITLKDGRSERVKGLSLAQILAD